MGSGIHLSDNSCIYIPPVPCWMSLNTTLQSNATSTCVSSRSTAGVCASRQARASRVQRSVTPAALMKIYPLNHDKLHCMSLLTIPSKLPRLHGFGRPLEPARSIWALLQHLTPLRFAFLMLPDGAFYKVTRSCQHALLCPSIIDINWQEFLQVYEDAKDYIGYSVNIWRYQICIVKSVRALWTLNGQMIRKSLSPIFSCVTYSSSC